MNSKVANVIALELGILIALMAWLAFSNLSGVRRHALVDRPERTAGSFATVSPILRPTHQRSSAADYRAGAAEQRPGDEEQPETVQEYDQAIATAPYNNADLSEGAVSGDPAYYSGVDQEPLLYPPDYLVSPQVIEYAQPNEIIVFSNAHACPRGRRPTIRGGGARMIGHRRITAEKPHARNGDLVLRRNTNSRSVSYAPRPAFRQSSALLLH